MPHRTTRWTGAAIAHIANCVIPSKASVIAPPGQRERWATLDRYETNRDIASCWDIAHPWLTDFCRIGSLSWRDQRNYSFASVLAAVGE
jgi:hypothetical protein